MSEKDSPGTDQLLPFERQGESPAGVSKSLFAALESEIPDEAEGTDEPAGVKAAKAESPEPEDDDFEEPEDSEGDEEEGSEEESDDDEQEPDEQPEELSDNSVLEIEGEKVTLRELKDGRLRQADYTRKTQALADQRRKAEAAESDARAVRDQLAERLEAVNLMIQEAQRSREPDWDKLRAENPQEYLLQRADWDRAERRAAEVRAEQERVLGERMADQERQFNAYLEEQKEKLHTAIPEWRDPVRSQAERTKLMDSLGTIYGWSPEELGTVTDHRLMLALRDAVRFREGQTKGKEKLAGKVKAATPALRPGARERVSSKAQRREVKLARNTLARTGRVDDAARLLETLLPD